MKQSLIYTNWSNFILILSRNLYFDNFLRSTYVLTINKQSSRFQAVRTWNVENCQNIGFSIKAKWSSIGKYKSVMVSFAVCSISIFSVTGTMTLIIRVLLKNLLKIRRSPMMNVNLVQMAPSTIRLMSIQLDMRLMPLKQAKFASLCF